MPAQQTPHAKPRRAIAAYTLNTFSSLRVRNYRLYFIGQGISLAGMWMQVLAQGWLVATLTNSPAMVGLVAALQFLPVLLFAPYGGVIADRFSKRRVLFVTQSLAGALALVLAALTATGVVRLWMVFALAGLLGIVSALDNPTRQAFVHELAGPDELRNAVTLNALEVNFMRMIGPALAGVVIVAIGLPLCFLVNGLTYAAVLICLVLMNANELHRSARLRSAKGQLRIGLAYVRDTPVIRDVLVMMALVGTFAYEFQVTLLNLAKFTFNTNAMGPALLTSATGIGAVVGGLFMAGRRTSPLKSLTLASFGFGLAMILGAGAPTLALTALVMVAVGGFSLVFTSLTNTILQLESAPQMRGRVMALWSVGFLGSTAIGAPLVGWIGEHDPRLSIAVGGVAALAAGLVGLRAMRRNPRTISEQALIEQPPIAEKEEASA